jgi:hypothetical protein
MQAAEKEDGAVLVEFALVLLPLLLIVFGFLQFGVAMNAKIDSTHLTAEAARYLAVNQNPGATATPPTSFQNYIRGRADTEYLKQGKVCVEYPITPAKVGDPVRVTMARNYSLVPLVGDALTPKLTILNVTSEATMRLEAVPSVAGGCVGTP